MAGPAYKKPDGAIESKTVKKRARDHSQHNTTQHTRGEIIPLSPFHFAHMLTECSRLERIDFFFI